MTRVCIRCLLGLVVVVIGVAMGLPGITSLFAQDRVPERLPTFEVASVKENVSGDSRARAQTLPGGRYVATNVLLKGEIAAAFLGAQPLALSRVLGGPEWIGSTRYDIVAKASTAFQSSPDGPSTELLLMVRSLLQDRFKLRAHLETRELPIYELVVARADGKLGPELRQSAVDCDALVAAVRGGAPLPERQPNEPPPCGAMRGPARVLAGGVPMAQFAMMLTNMLAVGSGPAAEGRLVIDKTGLTGRFAFTLAWTPESDAHGDPAARRAAGQSERPVTRHCAAGAAWPQAAVGQRSSGRGRHRQRGASDAGLRPPPLRRRAPPSLFRPENCRQRVNLTLHGPSLRGGQALLERRGPVKVPGFVRRCVTRWRRVDPR